jgi:hypothetical protein
MAAGSALGACLPAGASSQSSPSVASPSSDPSSSTGQTGTTVFRGATVLTMDPDIEYRSPDAGAS